MVVCYEVCSDAYLHYLVYDLKLLGDDVFEENYEVCSDEYLRYLVHDLKLLDDDISETASTENPQETVFEETSQPCTSFVSQFLVENMYTDVDEKAKKELVKKLEIQFSSTSSNESNLVQTRTSISSFQGVNKSENNSQQSINGVSNAVGTNKQNLAFTSLSGSRMPGVMISSVDGLKNQAVNQNGPVSISGSQLTQSQPSSVQNIVSSPINTQQASITMIRPGTCATSKSEAISIKDSLMSDVSSKKNIGLEDETVLEKETLTHINQVSDYETEIELPKDKSKASLKNSEDF